MVQLIVEFYSVLTDKATKILFRMASPMVYFQSGDTEEKSFGHSKMRTSFGYVQHRLDFTYLRFVFLGGGSAYSAITK